MLLRLHENKSQFSLSENKMLSNFIDLSPINNLLKKTNSFDNVNVLVAILLCNLLNGSILYLELFKRIL